MQLRINWTSKIWKYYLHKASAECDNDILKSYECN